MNGNPLAKNHLVLLDIDGVVADDSHRVHYALSKNWDRYFDLVSQDTPLKEGYDLAWESFRTKNTELQYLTGRRIDLYVATRDWLIKHKFPNASAITMRGFAHRNILARYKESVVRSAIESGKFASVVLYEDDPAVVEHINAVFGEGTAILCTWYEKNAEMVKHATA